MYNKLIDWFRVGRIQTAPATILLLEVPYLMGKNSTFIGAILLGVFGWFVHAFSFGQNSLCDTCTIHFRGKRPPDLADPSKKHHPLVAGRIKLSTAHNVIHWGLAILVTIAGFWSLLGANPAWSAVSLVIWVCWGWGYNMGLSKVSPLAFLPISICFVGLSGWSWFLSNTTIGQRGWIYLAFVFATILFQISWSGNLKELRLKERSNILVKMGAKVEWGKFEPGPAGIYGFSVKVINLAIGGLLATTAFGTVWWVVMTSLAGYYLIKLIIPRKYDRKKELMNMSIEEIVTIYLPVGALLPLSEAVPLMIGGILYFFVFNKILWRVPYPKV